MVLLLQIMIIITRCDDDFYGGSLRHVKSFFLMKKICSVHDLSCRAHEIISGALEIIFAKKYFLSVLNIPT